jgi:hypothetical protein
VMSFDLTYSSGCAYLGVPDPSRYPTSYGTFYIRVYRAVGGSASCLPYSITVQG